MCYRLSDCGLRSILDSLPLVLEPHLDLARFHVEARRELAAQLTARALFKRMHALEEQHILVRQASRAEEESVRSRSQSVPPTVTTVAGTKGSGDSGSRLACGRRESRLGAEAGWHTLPVLRKGGGVARM